MENYGKTWEENEVRFLIDNYTLKGSKYCSEYLKRNKKAILAKARRLGLKSGRHSYRYSKEYLITIIYESNSIKEVLEKMGLRAAGGNYRVINEYIKKYDIDISHFLEYRKNILCNLHKTQKTNLLEILTENSSFSRTHLKERLFKEGLKERCCELCGQGEEWQGKKMSLILDHINGVHNDNRIENLRIVCPNCNATLDTHAGKNIQRVKAP